MARAEKNLWKVLKAMPTRCQGLKDADIGVPDLDLLETTKDVNTVKIRDRLRKPVLPPCQEEWMQEGVDIHWSEAWKELWKPKVPPKWNDLAFLTRHRGLWTGSKAEERGWKGIPWLCAVCGVRETLKHVFWDCERAKVAREEGRRRGWATGQTFGELLSRNTVEQRKLMWSMWKRCTARRR